MRLSPFFLTFVAMDQHYHPLIFQRLRRLFDASDWEALIPYLEGLSHSHFRTAGYLLGERLLADVPPDIFWEVATRLILWHPKAFTVTMAKAAKARLVEGTLTLADTGVLRLSKALQGDGHQTDREKLLLQWLPAVRQPATMERLFSIFNVDDPRRRIEFLLRTDGLTAAFVLLRSLRFEEHDRPYLSEVCRSMIRRADSLSFNIASLLRTYFDLNDVRGVFSLKIEPYELSRLDTDFDTFCRVATKV